MDQSVCQLSVPLLGYHHPRFQHHIKSAHKKEITETVTPRMGRFLLSLKEREQPEAPVRVQSRERKKQSDQGQS